MKLAFNDSKSFAIFPKKIWEETGFEINNGEKINLTQKDDTKAF